MLPIIPPPEPTSILDILGVLSPFALPILLFILGNRKTALKLFRSALAMAKQGNEESEPDGIGVSAALMSRTDEMSKRIDLVSDIQDRFDDGLKRIDDMIGRFQAEIKREVLEVSDQLRRRLDSQLINDSKLHRAQNDRLDVHDEKFIAVETRLAAAEQTLVDLRVEVNDMKQKES